MMPAAVPAFPAIREVAFGSSDYQRIVAFREKWLRKPMGQVFTPEQLAPDADSVHYFCEEAEEIVGCVLLRQESLTLVRLRQLAVHPEWRGRGLGAHLTRHFEHEARARGGTDAILSARDYAISFYEKLGYAVEGEGYLSVGIPHHTMVKRL
jgi:ribosomal protein S18 acetylase RimI-like enzyme